MCVICFDCPRKAHKRYGLLEGCDHVFCVSCIHQWRLKGRSKEGAGEMKNWRSCPMCRTDSAVVWSSSQMLKGEEREDYIAMQEFEKSKTPCRDFRASRSGGGGWGGCKRGSRCLYQHLDENGKDAKPKQKREEDARASRRSRLQSTRADQISARMRLALADEEELTQALFAEILVGYGGMAALENGSPLDWDELRSRAEVLGQFMMAEGGVEFWLEDYEEEEGEE